MNDPKNPVPGEMIIDASDLDTVDLTKDEVRKAIKPHEGFDEAIACLLRLTPQQIARIGISADEIARIGGLHKEYKRAYGLEPAVNKMAELTFETRVNRGHKLSLLLGEIASHARRRAERDANGGEILGPLEELFTYQYGPANKGVATREKKAKAEAEAKKAE